MAKRAKPTKQVGKWIVTVSHGLHVKRDDGRVLVIGLTYLNSDGEWQVLALETSGAAARVGAQGVLDQHAHKLIGNFQLDVAFETARAYAKKWVTQGGHAEACACVDIDPLTDADIDEIAMRAAVDIKYPKRKRPYVRRSVRARA